LFSEPGVEKKKLKRSHSEDMLSANKEKIKKIQEWRRLKQAIIHLNNFLVQETQM
jgi:hypothetical protein